jgi:hypothetical protein
MTHDGNFPIPIQHGSSFPWPLGKTQARCMECIHSLIHRVAILIFKGRRERKRIQLGRGGLKMICIARALSACLSLLLPLLLPLLYLWCGLSVYGGGRRDRLEGQRRRVLRQLVRLHLVEARPAGRGRRRGLRRRERRWNGPGERHGGTERGEGRRVRVRVG